MPIKALQVPWCLYNLAQQPPPLWSPVMVADTVGLPLLPRGRGLEGARPPPAEQQVPAQLVQTWGATGLWGCGMRKGIQDVLCGS